MVKIAREGGESRSQVKLFFASAHARLPVKFALPGGKPPFCVRESASERPFLRLMCERLFSTWVSLWPIASCSSDKHSQSSTDSTGIGQH
jgi:hypothetical protein